MIDKIEMTKERMKELIKRRMANFDISFKQAKKEIKYIYPEYSDILNEVQYD